MIPKYILSYFPPPYIMHRYTTLDTSFMYFEYSSIHPQKVTVANNDIRIARYIFS